jgi:DNA-binding MarR family transcriptional regulator
VKPDAPVRWLDAREQHAWLALAHLMMRLPAALETQLQRDSGLSHFEYLVLATLSMTPLRRRRLSDLAELTGSGRSRLSNVVTKLERQGLVERDPDPDDGRSTLARLTESGWEVVVAAAPGHAREVRRLVLDPLSASQLEDLAAAARLILRTIDPEGADPAELLHPAGAP